MKKILINLLYALAFAVILFTGYLEPNSLTEASDKFEYQIQCTQIPSLYENWRRTVIEEDMHKRFEAVNDREFLRYVQKQKEDRVRTLSPRFLDIARMTAAQRKTEGERVLWENEKIMILVDNRYPAPKLLVVAKVENIWLITDADSQLRQDIALVSVAASDALFEAANRGCKKENFSEIEIHTIRQLGVQQLHIHVEPAWEIDTGTSEATFYQSVSKILIKKLGNGSNS